jgi:uncharacterized protein YqgV (UPF0045/DUF77 family)
MPAQEVDGLTAAAVPSASRGAAMIAEIQVLPTPAGEVGEPGGQGRYRHVEAAIEVLASSGLHHEVGALGTTVEGDPDDVWPLLRRAHEAALASGAGQVVSVVKVFSGPSAPGMDDLVAGHR